MIDPHVHLRDGTQAAKETLLHGLSVAWRGGLDGVFEMPNTDPPLTTRDALLRRIEAADAALHTLGVGLFHGVYAGITAVPRQIEEAVKAWRELFPRVVGLKMFAGQSTGNMGIPLREEQALVYRTLAALGFTGVLAVHCEKEAMMRPADWDPAKPVTHAQARPPAAEVASVDEQLQLASRASFKGTLHVCHLSTPWALDVLRGRAPRGNRRGAERACHLRSHPSSRAAGCQHAGGARGHPAEGQSAPAAPAHACHDAAAAVRRRDRLDRDGSRAAHPRRQDRGLASGIPGLPFLPVFLGMLAELGMPAARIKELSHDAVCRTFGMTLAASGRRPELDLAREYPFDPFAVLTRSST